jgi:DNA polymerase-1
MYSIEMPLIKVLVDMKLQGIILDVDRAKELELELLSDRDRVEDEIRHTLGDINLNSPKQLSEALFGRLGMPDLQGGSTKAAVLEELAEMGYEIAAKITEYKKSDKLISTYLTNAADLVAKTGRVHCNFNQLGTKTGRFSSSDPNLQNIPARSKQGKKIRRIFRASPGYALISADYSQIEPRLLSDVCNDPAMIQSYRDGIDIYAMMASKVFSFLAMRTAEELQKRAIIGNKHAEPGQPLSKDEVAINTLIPVKKSLVVDGFVYYDEENELWRHKELEPSDAYDGTLYRMMMKTLLLGLMYSMSPKGFASRLKISEDDAKELVDQFYKAFPTLKQVMWELKSQCQKDGFIETPWGRKRRIPEVWSDDKYERFRAERQILNSKIQGGAADIMKIAMLLVGYDPRIKELGGRLLLTVHDELIVEAPKDNAIQVTKYLIEDMSNAAHLKVPLKVDAEVFTDGRWYGESITVKRKGSDYVILEEKEVITEEQINWAV